MTTLLPCPFCGGEAFPMTIDCQGGQVIACKSCYTEGPPALLDPGTGERMHEVDRWNHRPIESALRARVEALEEDTDFWRTLAVNAGNEIGLDLSLLSNRSLTDAEREYALQLRPTRGALAPHESPPRVDEGERCRGRKKLTRYESVSDVESALTTRPCPGCPDCKEAP